MFDKLGQAADMVGRNLLVSRRGFFLSAAKAAAGVAGAVGAILALPAKSQAGALCWCLYNGSARCFTVSNCNGLAGTCTGPCS